jgi:hypothetical protein
MYCILEEMSTAHVAHHTGNLSIDFLERIELCFVEVLAVELAVFTELFPHYVTPDVFASCNLFTSSLVCLLCNARVKVLEFFSRDS